MSSPRDLSGFSAPPGLPDPPTPVADTSNAAKPRVKRRQPSAPKNRPERHRVCVSLTAETHDALRRLATARDCWKVEVILDGLERWDAELRASAAENGSGRRRRRRRGSNPTPYVMDLTSEELDRLDDLAIISAPSRSALVRRLIELEAAHENIALQDAS